MHAEDAGQNGGAQRHGRTPWSAALLLSALLTGLMAGGACWFAMRGADGLLRARVERAMDDTLALLRLAGAANGLATTVTQLESAATTPLRQSVHPALNQGVQQLGDALDALMADGTGERERLMALRASVAAVRAGVEDLNRVVDDRLAAERDLRAALEQANARTTAFAEALASLPPGDERLAIEAQARALNAQLLDAGLAPAPAGKAGAAAPRAGFRKTADALLADLNALRIDHASPRRAEAARRLVALGVDSGNLFDLRQDQARLAATAADIANTLRARAGEITAQTTRMAEARRAATLAERDRVVAGMVFAPAATGLAGALAVLALGGGALAHTRRSRRQAQPTATITPPKRAPANHSLADHSLADHSLANRPDGGAPLAEEIPPLHILLAEDEPVNQMAATAILRRAGHTVTLAGDGRSALEAMERERFDLVLMDLRMPEMDGIEATRRIRALSHGALSHGAGPHGAGPRPCVVMLTASAVPGDRERALAAGADEVLEKPLRYDALRPVLERFHAITPAAPAPATEPDPLPDFGIRGFDEAAIRQMREHLPAERVAALVGSTVSTLRQYHAALNEAWDAGDRAAVSALAHKIAGVAGVYGCVALRRIAQGLERAVETGEGDPTALNRQLTTAMVPAIAALEEQLAVV